MYIIFVSIVFLIKNNKLFEKELELYKKKYMLLIIEFYV